MAIRVSYQHFVTGIRLYGILQTKTLEQRYVGCAVRSTKDNSVPIIQLLHTRQTAILCDSVDRPGTAVSRVRMGTLRTGAESAPASGLDR